MINDSNTWQLVTGIAVAFLTGLISYLVFILSKEQKTSEFRQDWIDALRDDLSNFESLILTIAQHRVLNGKTDSYEEDIKIETLRVRLILRLNFKEHQKLIEEIKELNNIYEKDVKGKSREDIEKLISPFVNASSEVLKKEWKRVKRGEMVFWISKWVFFSVFIYVFFWAVDQLLEIYIIKFVPFSFLKAFFIHAAV